MAQPANGRGAAVRTGALVVLGALGFAAFLTFVAGARPTAATGGLVVGAGALVFSLGTLFRMVQALARPGNTIAPRPRELGGSDRSQLREEKRRLLRAINELKFDFEMGKLSEADFNEVKQTYELRAVDVMRELEGTQRVHPEVVALLEDRGLSEVVPEGTAKETTAQPAAEPVAAEASLESGENEDEDEDEDDASVSCGACKGSNDVDAKFCKHCGKEISA